VGRSNGVSSGKEVIAFWICFAPSLISVWLLSLGFSSESYKVLTIFYAALLYAKLMYTICALQRDLHDKNIFNKVDSKQ